MMTNAEFKARLVAREPMLGAFIKTPHPIVIEIMARAGFDFLVVDAEHAPFDRGTVDAMTMAGRAEGCPIVVRVPVATADWVLNVLDGGAAGVMVPHVETAAQAKELARAVNYGPGGRGFAGTSRAADYAGRSLKEHLSVARSEVALICQIEDPDGVVNHSEIADVDGVDALFIGRADPCRDRGGHRTLLRPDRAPECAPRRRRELLCRRVRTHAHAIGRCSACGRFQKERRALT